jgi:dipeptidyl aminopeptidase/acylaminoacyl peptidase
LAFVGQRPDGAGRSIQLLRLRDRQVKPLLSSRFDEMFPEFSPDGRWIAYASDESGRAEVYVQTFQGPGGKRQISGKGGSQPLWSPDGEKLFYRWEDQVWVVDVHAGSAFFAGRPRLVFEQPGLSSGAPIRGWDISPDGRRFLMVKFEERKPQPVTEMVFIQNWFEELKRLVPTR